MFSGVFKQCGHIHPSHWYSSEMQSFITSTWQHLEFRQLGNQGVRGDVSSFPRVWSKIMYCSNRLRLENATISNCKRKVKKKNSSPGRKKMQWKSGLLFFKFAFSVFFSCGCFFSHFVYMCFLFFHKVFRFFLCSNHFTDFQSSL